jgi:thioredoxin reductase (NADPH)
MVTFEENKANMQERTTLQMITLYGAPWCPDCRRSKKFLTEQRIPFTYIDIEAKPEHQAYVEQVNDGKRIIPTIVFEDKSILVEPSDAELAAKLGLTQVASRSAYDLIVIGGGPTGLTAALYGAREGMDVLVIDRSALGGQVGVTERLDNFPGFPEGISGSDFAERLIQQAKRFGVETLSATEVKSIMREDNAVCVTVASGHEYGARAVLIATGSTYRLLGVPGEDELFGAGIHFCATCDGPFYRGGHVAVIGGGNSAGEEGLFLTRFADKVTMLVRGSELKASKIVADNVLAHPKIDVRFNTQVQRFNGEHRMSSIDIKNASGESETITPDGAFIFIGLSPNSGWLPETIKRDDYGFVLTDKTLETSIPGVFAAGDVRAGSTKQAASAAGEGATHFRTGLQARKGAMPLCDNV